jgi:hypothetical protein
MLTRDKITLRPDSPFWPLRNHNVINCEYHVCQTIHTFLKTDILATDLLDKLALVEWDYAGNSWEEREFLRQLGAYTLDLYGHDVSVGKTPGYSGLWEQIYSVGVMASNALCVYHAERFGLGVEAAIRKYQYDAAEVGMTLKSPAKGMYETTESAVYTVTSSGTFTIEVVEHRRRGLLYFLELIEYEVYLF